MKFLSGFIFALLLGAAIVYYYFKLGYAPVATVAPPMPFEVTLAHMALHARIDKDAPKTPPFQPTEADLQNGAQLYREHCAVCHGLSDESKTAVAKGMYPKPPTLIAARLKWTPSELFWIVKHGIKMSGMPSWADHSDDDLWNTVAFLEQLPGMSQADYERLVEESKAGGHAMHGNMPMRMDGAGGPPAPSFEEKP